MPLIATISPGQQHETQQAQILIERLPEVGQDSGPGQLLGDKGYSAGWLRDWLKEKKIEPVIAHKRNEKAASGPFDREVYRQRHWVEQCIGWIKENRRLATRYEKLAIHYLGMLTIGMILRFLKIDSPNTA